MADMTESDYATMTNSEKRLHAASEVRAEYQGFFADLTKRLTRILGYKSQLGSGDTIVLQGFIDTATALYQTLNTSNGNLQAQYKVFLTGDDGEE